METQIECTPEQMAAARREDGSLDMERLRRLAAGAADDDFGADDEEPDALAALGCRRVIGDCRVSNSLARLLLLKEVNSVFMAGGEAGLIEPSVTETARALYILAKGPDAFSKLLAAQRFEKALERLEHLATTPQQLEVYLAAVERASIAQADWDREALSFFELQTTGILFADVVREIARVIRSGCEALNRLPKRLVVP